MILPKRTWNLDNPTYGDLQYDDARQMQINSIWYGGLKLLLVVVAIVAGLVYIFS